MKNNKGFVVSAVLYPLLVLFLALIMGLLSMSDTRKRILDKMKLEISDSIFDEATCSCDTILNKLNYIIKNGVAGSGGGGGSYAQNTVGVSVEPYHEPSALPHIGNNIGDVGIITETEIANYYVSRTAPDNPKHGTVWIVQDIVSNYHIVSDYSNLGISYGMQYICNDSQTVCNWELKKTYVYDNQKWIALYYVPLVSSKVDLTSTDVNAEIIKTFEYTGDVQEFHATFSGTYKFELWGASGGNIYGAGLGAYTSGEMYLDAGDILYIYVGGTSSNQTGGYNGGGAAHNLSSGTDRGYGFGGGGATDIRLVKGETADNFESLKSRIMVAAGGGGDARRWYSADGNYYSNGRGGAGGGLTGYDGSVASSGGGWSTSGQQGIGAKQTIGGYRNNNWNEIGAFGIGYSESANAGGAGGGGGYYGGGPSIRGVGASGGSSYISGHTGSISIKESSTAENIQIDGSKYHYSGYYFNNTQMIDGNGYDWANVRGEQTKMPNVNDDALIVGNLGNGHAKVTLLTIEILDKESILDDKDENADEWKIPYSSSSLYTGTEQVFVAPYTGIYNIQLWGARSANLYGAGYGAYTAGDIFLKKGTKLYIYNGGTSNTYRGGWNGGGTGLDLGSGTDRGYGYGGGGATDIRLVSASTANDFESLKSRIMVAAGGGGDSSRWYSADGNYYSNGRGGAGGGLTGYDGSVASSGGGWSTSGQQGIGATQSLSGYRVNAWTEIGSFGIGADAVSAGGAGGGGGYYGGGPGVRGIGSGGGSSYISGHEGSQSISETSISTNIINTGSKYHYSGYYFTNTTMIDGNGYKWTTLRTEKVSMPTYDETSTMVGNSSYGNTKIKLVSKIETDSRDKKYYIWHYTYTGTNLYNGAVQEFTAPVNGVYEINLWGARGGSINYGGGKGAYTKGDIYLTKGTKLYIYVGGITNTYQGGWNGGGTGMNWQSSTDRRYGYGGGGATDIRLTSGSSVDDFESLKSRIMVAAGGGADSSRYYTEDAGGYHSYGGGGSGGGLNGYDGFLSNVSNWSVGNVQGTGGTQNMHGYTINNWNLTASFGIGATHTASGGGGGGGGYYGGGTSSTGGNGAGGGSSYISGHEGCNSLDKDSTLNAIVNTGQKYHHSGYYFTNTQMIDGNGYNWTDKRGELINMPNFDETSAMTGNSSFGNAKIRLKEEKTEESKETISNVWTYAYTGLTAYVGSVQEFTAPVSANYSIELWGARGGSINYGGGKGAYTKGDIYLTKGTKLYIYVGGITNTYQGGWNGGGTGMNWQSGSDRRYGYGGGGATDIRLNKGSGISDLDSLKSRIMVAAGGGADSSRYYTADAGGYHSYGGGGAGGGLVGYSGFLHNVSNWSVGNVQGTGGTQIAPGYVVNNTAIMGAFGIGSSHTASGGGGGGGGYYGGGTSGTGGNGAGGGSSFISGHEGCIAIDSTGNPLAEEYTTLANSYHYSNYKFSNTTMIDGTGYNWTTIKESLVQMPTFDKTTTMVGNSSSGYARITKLD